MFPDISFIEIPKCNLVNLWQILWQGSAASKRLRNINLSPLCQMLKKIIIFFLHYEFKLLLSKSEEKKISGKTFQVPNHANFKFRPHRIRVRCFETFLNSWRRRRFSVMLWYCLALKQPSHQVSTHSMNRQTILCVQKDKNMKTKKKTNYVCLSSIQHKFPFLRMKIEILLCLQCK